MARIDEDLAFILRYENVAWYEGGKVRILDRRVYPEEIDYVVCNSHTEVARAIADMVTQSYGPHAAAAMGMALAAHEAMGFPSVKFHDYMERAAYTLSHARPTTSAKMVEIIKRSLDVAKNAYEAGEKPDVAVFLQAVADLDERYLKSYKVGQYLVSMFPSEGIVMTQCYAETMVGMMLKECRACNKKIKFYCPETRPYLQGARLTASVICDMGFDVTVITDNMPAYIVGNKNVDIFTSAADVITLDGHVVNKIGTFQIALAAHYWGIPYFVTGMPDAGHPRIESVEIEERDPDFVLHAMGRRTAMQGVKGCYPAFDITPPHLVGGVVTDKGIFAPYDLKSYFKVHG